jgi:hypothetical protein
MIYFLSYFYLTLPPRETPSQNSVYIFFFHALFNYAFSFKTILRFNGRMIDEC